jgi:hypothetical protein
MMAVIVAMLVWEIRQNYSDREWEVAKRRLAQEKLEDLTQTLESRHLLGFLPSMMVVIPRIPLWRSFFSCA